MAERIGRYLVEERKNEIVVAYAGLLGSSAVEQLKVQEGMKGLRIYPTGQYKDIMDEEGKSHVGVIYKLTWGMKPQIIKNHLAKQA